MLTIDLRNTRITNYSYSVIGNKDSDVIYLFSHFVQYANSNIYIKILSDYVADKIAVPSENISVEDGMLSIKWVMPKEACYAEKLALQLQFEDNGVIAQSRLVYINLANTLNIDEVIVPVYPQILEHLQEEIDELKGAVGVVDVEMSFEDDTLTLVGKDKDGETLFVQTANIPLNDKVDKVEGKGLSTNDYTNDDKAKLEGIEAGAEVNDLEGVQMRGADLPINNKKVNINDVPKVFMIGETSFDEIPSAIIAQLKVGDIIEDGNGLCCFVTYADRDEVYFYINRYENKEFIEYFYQFDHQEDTWVYSETYVYELSNVYSVNGYTPNNRGDVEVPAPIIYKVNNIASFAKIDALKVGDIIFDDTNSHAYSVENKTSNALKLIGVDESKIKAYTYSMSQNVWNRTTSQEISYSSLLKVAGEFTYIRDITIATLIDTPLGSIFIQNVENGKDYYVLTKSVYQQYPEEKRTYTLTGKYKDYLIIDHISEQITEYEEVRRIKGTIFEVSDITDVLSDDLLFFDKIENGDWVEASNSKRYLYSSSGNWKTLIYFSPTGFEIVRYLEEDTPEYVDTIVFDVTNYYTKTQIDTLLGAKQNTIDSSHKLSSDLVDDTNHTHKFATAEQLTQIATNQTNISNVDDKLNANVHIEGNQPEITYNGDVVTKVSPYKNLKTGATGSRSEQIELADDTHAGMMSHTDYLQIRENTARIEQLEGQTTRLLYTTSQNPTAQNIADFVDAWLAGKGILNPTDEDYAGIAVVIAGTFHIWHYYANQTPNWRDDGVDTTSQFTNALAGVIKGKDADGFVYAENDGTGSVKGWGDLKTRVSNLESNDQIQDTAIGNLQSGKVDKVTGKGLSTNDYTDTDKNKLAGIEAGAQVNVIEGVQVNGVDLTPDANKKVNVSVPTKVSDLNNDSHFVTESDMSYITTAPTSANTSGVIKIVLLPESAEATTTMYNGYIYIFY